MPDAPFHVGLIGWGLSGRYFHAPFITHTPGLLLDAVVTSRRPDRHLFPTLRRLDSVEALWADPAIDLVVVASPNRLHVAHATAALEAGKHVIVEKPVAETADAVTKLIATAQAADRLLIPFQNRRWDGDFMTVQRLLAGDLLGPIHFFESRWEKYRPTPKQRAGWKATADPMHGLLYDLGPHLIDQALVLFGAPAAVYAQVARLRAGTAADDWFRIDLHFAGGVHALLEVDNLNPFPAARFHVRGRYGSFQKFGLDPQEERLVAGAMPDEKAWGEDDPAQWGRLRTSAGVGVAIDGRVETVPGNYGLFYEGVYRALCGDGPAPVDAQDVVTQLTIIAAALASAETGRLQEVTRK